MKRDASKGAGLVPNQFSSIQRLRDESANQPHEDDSHTLSATKREGSLLDIQRYGIRADETVRPAESKNDDLNHLIGPNNTS